MATRILVLVVSIVVLTGGCSFVDTTSGGKKVRVLAIDEVKSCRKLGQTATSVLADIAGIPRPESTIKDELETVGRNSAAKLGGDTIVPATSISDGEQTFYIYKCVDPDSGS